MYALPLIATLCTRQAVAESNYADIARYLAGIPPTSPSALGELTDTPEWKVHAKYLGARWAQLEQIQLAKVRKFADRELGARQPVVSYMFGGPDFAYINAFFPAATTYILSGLEPVLDIPDPASLTPIERTNLLFEVRASTRTFFEKGFFRTEDMHSPGFPGVVQLLSMIIARSEGEILSLDRVYLDSEGKLTNVLDESRKLFGARIRFTIHDQPPQEVFYFSVDLSNKSIVETGFLKFCAAMGSADAFVKSASYLPHEGDFSVVRDFILEHSQIVVQDDSGIPLRNFSKGTWDVRVFGHYRAPIGPMSKYYQPDLETEANGTKRIPVDFKIGYAGSARDSILLVGRRKQVGKQ